MQIIKDYNSFSISTIKTDERWNNDEKKHYSMHSIHSYPAKFPPLIASEAFIYAKEEGVRLQSCADVFCGCGTVALESKLRNIPFWGCDINPVAVLITRAKVNSYEIPKLEQYYKEIVHRHDIYMKEADCNYVYSQAIERLVYWFDIDSYCDLFFLKEAILDCVDEEVYKEGFLCLFSSILKTASRWLQKSIKPQIDPYKRRTNIMGLFGRQFSKFIAAVSEMKESQVEGASSIIVTANFLESQVEQKTDLIITSPPYVTSYEYADLHQLSSLWLGYTNDYRELRNGSIGSIYNTNDIDSNDYQLNNTASMIIDEMINQKIQPSKIKSVGRYYYDMQKAINTTHKMLNKNGMSLFVIGDSEIRGVKLLNSLHLIESMQNCGYKDIKVGKRTIEKSLCIPYRDLSGKFTKKGKAYNEIYHEEFVISGRKE